MKIKFMVAATLMAALVTTTSCGNSNKQSQSETVSYTHLRAHET